MIVPAYTDVVHGKGFSINMRPGNKIYRSLIEMVKSDYDAAPKSLKGMYGNQIVNHIYNLSPPGRFLRKDDTSGIWVEVGKEEAVRKARQALRDTKPKQLVDNRAGGGDGFHRIQRTPVSNAANGLWLTTCTHNLILILLINILAHIILTSNNFHSCDLVCFTF